jgi:carotenoid cleavage dioxygenase-like enzyme
MKRRHFMSGLAAAPLAAGADLAQASHLYWKPFRPGDHVALTSPDTVWKNAFDRVPAAFDSQVAMRVPEGLRGVLYRNGPALMTLGGTAYEHWLDGDGMMHAFRFGAGTLTHRARMTGTHKLKAEIDAGRRTAPGFGTTLPGTRVTGADDMNTANISPLLVNGELLALWEGGAPYVLDPQTLATRGRKSYSPQTDTLPFSAHPRADAAGNLWSFGYLPTYGALALYQMDASGALVRQGFVPAPNADMVHDFAITERYLVFVLMPYRYDVTRTDPSLSFIGHYQWQAGQPSTVLVIDKATFAVVRQIDIPTLGVFHLGNAWEQGNTLRFGVIGYPDFAAIIDTGMRQAMSSSMRAWPESRWIDFEVDLAAGTANLTTPRADAVEFPVYDLRRTGRPTRHAYMMASQWPAAEPVFGFNVLRAIDQQTAQVQDWRYGDGIVAEEHVFVPAPGSDVENQGWLVGTALDWKRRVTMVSIFDAAQVAAGPIEQVALPYGLPLGVHGRFYAG